MQNTLIYCNSENGRISKVCMVNKTAISRCVQSPKAVGYSPANECCVYLAILMTPFFAIHLLSASPPCQQCLRVLENRAAHERN